MKRKVILELVVDSEEPIILDDLNAIFLEISDPDCDPGTFGSPLTGGWHGTYSIAGQEVLA